jgi:hypothetical protein
MTSNPLSPLSIERILLCRTIKPIEECVEFSSLHTGHIGGKYKVFFDSDDLSIGFDSDDLSIGYIDQIYHHKIPQLRLTIKEKHYTNKYTICINDKSIIYRLSSGVIYYTFLKLPDDVTSLINQFLFYDPKNPIVKISS